MRQLKITLIRHGNEDEDMNTALAIMNIDRVLDNSDGLEVGVLKDDDGLLAVWEVEDF